MPKRASIAVTGGAGYIGSHTVRVLLERGYGVTVIDNLSRGHAHNVDSGILRIVDLTDAKGLRRVFDGSRVEAVIHFAAYIAVGESMRYPGLYFANNIGGSVSLIEAMLGAGVSRLVFSSSAAVYGMPDDIPIKEDAPFAPVSPYGESKAAVERLLRWYDRVHGLRSISLRYFNASGADPKGNLGEEHDPETHLIPLVLQATEAGQPLTIFGDDYDTPDGTCIRDYIHVTDLAEAHILALESLLAGRCSDAFNAGTGAGHSVREVIRAVEDATGRKVPYEIGARRPGDPRALVADSTKLRNALRWTPHHSGLREIVASAWTFEQARKARAK